MNPIIIPTLDLDTLDVETLVEQAWEYMVAQGREPRDKECWDLGFRMGIVAVLQPLVEKRFG